MSTACSTSLCPCPARAIGRPQHRALLRANVRGCYIRVSKHRRGGGDGRTSVNALVGVGAQECTLRLGRAGDELADLKGVTVSRRRRFSCTAILVTCRSSRSRPTACVQAGQAPQAAAAHVSMCFCEQMGCGDCSRRASGAVVNTPRLGSPRSWVRTLPSSRRLPPPVPSREVPSFHLASVTVLL